LALLFCLKLKECFYFLVCVCARVQVKTRESVLFFVWGNVVSFCFWSVVCGYLYFMAFSSLLFFSNYILITKENLFD
jgi:hypothetical protein